MKIIIKQVVRSYLANVFFWIGLMIVTAGIFQQVEPYLKIHYISSEQNVLEFKDVLVRDVDFVDGYVPSSPEQQRVVWEEIMKESLVSDIKMTDSEAQSIIQSMKTMKIEDACRYLEEKYGYYGAMNSYEDAAFHMGTMEEQNSYLDSKLEKHSFSFYFARKFADFTGLFMAFFAIVILAILFIQDTRKCIYELLHTKPVSAAQYVLGKVFGGFFTCCIVLGLLNVIFYILCLAGTRGNGFEIYFLDFILATILYVLPNMLMIVCVYALIALLFKNPLPAVPLLFLYVVYSNMGSLNAAGRYGYFGKPLAIMVRFPGRFFDTAPPPLVYMNQLFLILASIIIIFISVQLWKRRRAS